MFRSGSPLQFDPRPEREASAVDDQTRPMIVPVIAAPPVGAGRTASPVMGGLSERIRAAGIHLALSAVAAGLVLCLVLLAWYPAPMTRLHGVDAILLIMLAVDVVIGPVFTFIVFDRRKKALALDLATIAVLQLAAMAYGLHTVHQGRPAFVVLVKDRFEVVAPSELKAEARAQARGNPHAIMDALGPRWVAARMPESPQESNAILLEALAKGRDVQHHPKLYGAYAAEAAAAVDRALPIARLRALNPQRTAEVDAAVARTGRPESGLRYLPLRAPARDGAVLLAYPGGETLSVLPIQPW